MQKTKTYRRVKFDSQALSEVTGALGKDASYSRLKVDFPHEEWVFDTLHEFLAAAQTGDPILSADNPKTKQSLYLLTTLNMTTVTVGAQTRTDIEAIFALLDKHVDRCRTPEEPQDEETGTIFIGHGSNPQWRDLKDHLQDQHGYDVEAYEIGSRAGHAVRDVLEEMLEESSVALLLMTGEDETKEGKLRARQNVVHEAGLFQGRLGFTRAVILLEEGTEEFSNIEGLHQIRFPKGRIRETFGDVLAFLKREIG